MKNKLR